MSLWQLFLDYWEILFGSVKGNKRRLSTKNTTGVLSHEEYKEEIVRLLKAEPNDLTPRSYELTLHVPENHAEKSEIVDLYGNEHAPMTEVTLLPNLKNQSVRNQHSRSRIIVKLELSDSHSPMEPVVLTHKVFSSDFELEVYVHDLQPSNLVETLPIPAMAAFTVGRYDYQEKADVAIGEGEAAALYPMLQDRSKKISLLQILSRRAFTIHQHTRTYWGCQSRKQGQYIAVKNDEAKKTEFPLEYPERKALYKTGDYIVVFSKLYNDSDRILFKIVQKQSETS